MINFFSFAQSFLLINCVILFFYTFGYYIFFLTRKWISTSETLNKYYLAFPLLGFSITSIIFNYFYFLFDLSSSIIFSLSIIFFFIFFIFLFKEKEFIKSYLKITLRLSPIFFTFIFLTLAYGEQYYVFRGNYYDNMNYISQSILINDFKFSEILNFLPINDNSYIDHGSLAIKFRPLTSFFLSLFLNFKIFNFFYMMAIYKIFLVSLTFLSFVFLFNCINSKRAYFYSFSFIFSFWLFYIYEIDALSHLSVISLFIFGIALLIDDQQEFIFLNKKNIFFLIISIAFFFLYPEFFLINAVGILLYLFLGYKKNLLKLEKIKCLIYFLLIFLAITIPLYQTTYHALFLQIKTGLRSDIDFWGYYSTFLLGRDNDFINQENIQILKNIFNNNKGFNLLIKNLIGILYDLDYFLVPLNFIPSFFGLYFLSISKFLNFYDFFIIFLIILLNLYLLKIVIKNFIYIYKNNENLCLILKSFSIIFIILFMVLFFRNGFWQITKLFSYLGPLIFIFMSINFIKKNSFNQFKLNNLYLFLLIIFPIYKFSDFNDGIGRYDTFPSIIKPYYKKNIIWKIDNDKLKKCGVVFINSNDPIISGYLSIKLRNINFYHSKFKTYELKDHSKKLKNCNVSLKNSLFNITYD